MATSSTISPRTFAKSPDTVWTLASDGVSVHLESTACRFSHRYVEIRDTLAPVSRSILTPKPDIFLGTMSSPTISALSACIHLWRSESSWRGMFSSFWGCISGVSYVYCSLTDIYYWGTIQLLAWLPGTCQIDYSSAFIAFALQSI